VRRGPSGRRRRVAAHPEGAGTALAASFSSSPYSSFLLLRCSGELQSRGAGGRGVGVPGVVGGGCPQWTLKSPTTASL
jgi:hypothetical protein